MKSIVVFLLVCLSSRLYGQLTTTYTVDNRNTLASRMDEIYKSRVANARIIFAANAAIEQTVMQNNIRMVKIEIDATTFRGFPNRKIKLGYLSLSQSDLNQLNIKGGEFSWISIEGGKNLSIQDCEIGGIVINAGSNINIGAKGHPNIIGKGNTYQAIYVSGNVDRKTSNITIQYNLIGLENSQTIFDMEYGLFIKPIGDEINRRSFLRGIRIIGNTVVGFKRFGIHCNHVDDVVIEGNFVNTDPTGTFSIQHPLWNTKIPDLDGINLLQSTNLVVKNNTIAASNNGLTMISCTQSVVTGNKIGISADGTKALSVKGKKSNGNGIYVSSNAANFGNEEVGPTQIGGLNESDRNIIVSCYQNGIFINDMTYTSSTPIRVTNNIIGKSWKTEVSDPLFGITESGIKLRLINNKKPLADGFITSIIGGTEPGSGNIIANTSQHAISLPVSADNNIIRGNFFQAIKSGFNNIFLNPLNQTNYGNNRILAPTINNVALEQTNSYISLSGRDAGEGDLIDVYLYDAVKNSYTYIPSLVPSFAFSNGTWNANIAYTPELYNDAQESKFYVIATSTKRRFNTYGFTSIEVPANNTSEFSLLYAVTIKPEPDVICNECVGSFSPRPGEKYLLSAWVKEKYYLNPPASYTKSGIQLSFNGTTNALPIAKGNGPIIDGWQRIDTAFTVPSNASAINIELINNNADGDVFFDDIRIHPFRSNMKSFVYDPYTQRLTAELDENNYSTRYEYDDEGILIRVKKETERGVMTIKETRNNQSKINK